MRGALDEILFPSGLAGDHLIRPTGNRIARNGSEWMKSAHGQQRTSLNQTCIFLSVMKFLKDSPHKVSEHCWCQVTNTGRVKRGYANVSYTIPRDWHHRSVQGEPR